MVIAFPPPLFKFTEQTFNAKEMNKKKESV